MTTLAVRATSVKNSNDMHRVSDIRFMVLRLPNTQMFSAENDINDYGAYFWFHWLLFLSKHLMNSILSFDLSQHFRCKGAAGVFQKGVFYSTER